MMMIFKSSPLKLIRKKRSLCILHEGRVDMATAVNGTVQVSVWQKYDEIAEPCVGCYWHDCLRPMKEKLCPNLADAKDKHREEVKKVMEKIQ